MTFRLSESLFLSYNNFMEELEIKKVIGLMSGTSCDSIDAGLCEVYPDMSVKLIQGINHAYPEHIQAKIFSAFRGDISIKELCQLNFAVGKCFADAANVLISEFGKPDFISSHGQTIYHYPFDERLDNISLKQYYHYLNKSQPIPHLLFSLFSLSP